MATGSGAMSGNIGIPLKLLHESEGHTVSVELKTGEVYRGHLVESEDNMNMQLSNVAYAIFGVMLIGIVIVTGATREMTVSGEETFGPLAPLFKFDTVDEVIELDAPFFLSVAVQKYRVMSCEQKNTEGAPPIPKSNEISI